VLKSWADPLWVCKSWQSLTAGVLRLRAPPKASVLRAALARHRGTLGDAHPRTLALLANLGRLLQGQGRLDEARPLLQEALVGQRVALGDTHAVTLALVYYLSELLQGLGRLGEAQLLYNEALAGGACFGSEKALQLSQRFGDAEQAVGSAAQQQQQQQRRQAPAASETEALPPSQRFAPASHSPAGPPPAAPAVLSPAGGPLGVRTSHCPHSDAAAGHKRPRSDPQSARDTGSRDFCCLQCGKAFGLMSNLRAYIKMVHQGVKKHACDRCDKAFGYANDLRRHVAGHNGVRAFKCDECGKGFGTAGNMRAHACRAHSGVKFRCARCGRASALAARAIGERRSAGKPTEPGLVECMACSLLPPQQRAQVLGEAAAVDAARIHGGWGCQSGNWRCCEGREVVGMCRCAFGPHLPRQEVRRRANEHALNGLDNL
jgi:tetratricopeptide (TPR) repeat protein